jgi:hypothetical protein
MTEVLGRDDRELTTRTHRLVVGLPRAAPTSNSCDWSLITRPVAPNTIATHVIEIRCNNAPDTDDVPSFGVWINGECVQANMAAGESCSIVIDSAHDDHAS